MADDVLLDRVGASSAELSIGAVAERTGLSVHAVRFYERAGLFAEPVERVSGRRVFTDEHVEWLRFCTTMRASGMPLAALRAYTELVRRGDDTQDERLALLREHRDRISSQIRDLSRCLDLIDYKVGVYEDLAARGEPAASCRAPAPRR